MKTRTLFSAALAAALLVCAQMPAHAQASRTFVSGVGSDANPCSRTAPCRTFAAAITVTAAGGEINVLDTGGYGSVTITKSISIVNDVGGTAAILAGNGNGITIAAGATDTIFLRGLVIDGGGPSSPTPGVNGIQFNSGGALHISNTVIKNFTKSGWLIGTGIMFAPSGASKLYVSDTIVSNNGANSFGGGIWIGPTGSGSANATINRVTVENSQMGIVALGITTSGPIYVTIRDSVASGMAYNGFYLVSPSAGGQPVQGMIENSASVNNTTGISASGASAYMLLSNSTLTGNSTGLSMGSGGQIVSYGNNRINGNKVTDGVPLGPTMTK